MAAGKETAAGILYVVATPIGNLEDITLRALRILGEVDRIAAEDTRHTRKLLANYDIHTPLLSYYRGREAERSARIRECLAAGEAVALVTDAGTPAVSDPGARLVREVREEGFRIETVPGPSALTAALSLAGFEESGFVFLGFLPSRVNDRRKLLAARAEEPLPLVFYESPQRIVASLGDCLEQLGDRSAVVVRELTKIHEEVLAGPLAGLLADLEGRERVKGELVVLVAGCDRTTPAAGPEAVEARLAELRSEGRSVRDAVRLVMAELKVPRSAVYGRAVRLWQGEEG